MILYVAFAACPFVPVIAQVPDSSFGTYAIASTNYYGTEEVYNTVAMHSGNKVVAAGYAKNGNGIKECVLTRYLTNGTLDNAFNSNGKVTVSTTVDEMIKRIAVQSDGKIVAVGTRDVSPSSSSIIIMRFTSSGALDNSFGNSGKIVLAPSTGRDFGNNVVLQSDGKILIAGTEDYSKYVLLRYNSDGTPDNSFGTNGMVSSSYDPNLTAQSEGIGIAIQPDGKILISGGLWGANPSIGVSRYNTDGTIDVNFGYQGRVILTSPNSPADPEMWGGEDIVVASNGKIYLPGAINGGSIAKQPVIICLDASGQIDNSFGTLGYAKASGINFYEVTPHLAIEADGKILAGGSIQANNSDSLLILRFNTNGTQVNTFGKNGRLTIGRSSKAFTMNDMLLQSDGKILAAGFDHYMNHKTNMVMRIGKTGATSSINELGIDMDITVYPNPTSGIVNLSLPTSLINAKLNVEVVNVNGQITLERSCKGEQNLKLDVSKLEQGNYWISVFDNSNNRFWNKSLLIE